LLKDDLIREIRFVNGHADVWRLFDNGAIFGEVVTALAEPFGDGLITRVAGIEARGFILGAAVARLLGVGFAAIRKEAGLFPGPKVEQRAARDYRGNEVLLRLRRASLDEGDAVLLVDDWFETGSQARAAKTLIEACGARLIGAAVVVDQLPPEAAGTLGTYHALVRADELRGA
jgi:adenine phosphoribosyltransferase